jgi:hypothetical protein
LEARDGLFERRCHLSMGFKAKEQHDNPFLLGIPCPLPEALIPTRSFSTLGASPAMADL